MTRTYSQMHRTDKYPQHSSMIILPVYKRKKTPKQIYEHNFACLQEKENAETKLQWNFNNSNYHRTEEIIRVEGRVRNTESHFPETNDQETSERAIEKFGLGSIRLAGP